MTNRDIQTRQDLLGIIETLNQRIYELWDANDNRVSLTQATVTMLTSVAVLGIIRSASKAALIIF